MTSTRIIVAAILTIGTSTAAMAQLNGYTVTTPGQPRSFITQSPQGGGFTVTTPGQPRTFVQPSGPGGYTVFTPGQPRSFIQPQGSDDSDDDE